MWGVLSSWVIAVKAYGEGGALRLLYVRTCVSRKYDMITGYKYGYDHIEHKTRYDMGRIGNNIHMEFEFEEITE